MRCFGLVERIRAAGTGVFRRDELPAAQWASREPFADAVNLLREQADVVKWRRAGFIGRRWSALRLPCSLSLQARREIAVGDFKMRGITRKHAIPLLEYFDSNGLTIRKGNARMAGPRPNHVKKLVEKPKLGLPESIRLL
jgi:hypothetical protein